MTDEQPLPRAWVRDFEGKLSARYRREPVGVEVVIEPRYAAEDGRPSREPSAFRVAFRRPFGTRGNRIESPLTTVETFEAAKEVARSYMETYDERYRRVHDGDDAVRTRSGERDRSRTASTVAVAAASELAPSSDEQLLEYLDSVLADGLRALWHATPRGLDPVLVADHVDLDEERMGDLAEALGTLDRDAVGEVLRDDVTCVSVSLEDSVLYQFVVDTGHSTFVLVDEARGVQFPNFVREMSALLAARHTE